MMGMHGEAHVNHAIQDADLLLAFGMRFDDRVTGKIAEYAPKARKVHVDIDAAELNKNVPVDVPIQGDLRQVLEQLLPLVEPASHGEWLEQIGRWRADSQARDIINRPEQDGRLLPPRIVHAIWQMTEDRRSWSPTWARTRCGRRSTITSTGPTASSAPAGWGRWALACRRRWGAVRPAR